MNNNGKLDLNKIIEEAISYGFSVEERPAILNGKECLSLVKKNDFTVRGEHSYEYARYYLVIDGEEGVIYLCYKPSITYNLPADNEEYPHWLNVAADFAGEVSGTEIYVDHGIRCYSGSSPLTARIEEMSELEDLEWFTRAVMCYQTVIEMMVEGHSTPKTF